MAQDGVSGGVSWHSSAEDFGQKVDLTVRIREILRNYPEGLSILKELIQNADDAGARTVRFCAAEPRSCVEGDDTKLFHLMKGPSLLAYNSAKFTETDFRSIQRIGDSLKKDATGSKTGRFGVGVNSTYHLTDVPMFASGTKCVLFDPQAEFVPGINPANPGKLIDCSKKSGCALVSNLPHVFDPLKVFGCKLNGEDFNGTLFRFAIRTPEFASSSRLSRHSHSLDDMKSLLREMASEAPQMLLFLKNVECIEIYEWKASDEKPILTHQTKVHNPSDTLRGKRSYMLHNSSIPENPKAIDYFIDIISDGVGTVDQGGKAHTNERWIVCNQLGGGNASRMAKDKNLSHMKLIPWAGVATRVSPPSNVASGTAYCFLPLPVQTQMSIHVNGYFELSSNRRDIWWGTDMAGDGKSRAIWNHSLLVDIAAPCYCRLVFGSIKSKVVEPESYEFLFPQKSLSGPWQVLGDRFFDGIKHLPVLYSKCAKSGDWVSPADSLVLHDENDKLLAEILSHDQLPLVLFQSQDLKNMLLSHKSCLKTTKPETLRQYFSKRTNLVNGALENQENKINYAEYLLALCISDLDSSSEYTGLIGCQFIPLADGSLGKFHSLPNVNLKDLNELQTMGFPKLTCMHSLRKFGGDINSAMEWLLAHRYEDSVSHAQENLDPYILCDGEGASLLSIRAAKTFVDNDRIKDSNVRKFFRKIATSHLLNLVALEPDMLADVIMRAIPREWRGCDSVKWTHHESVEVDSTYPTIDWFTALWRYICSCNDIGQSISSVAEQYCIVPTEQNLVCNLSPGASVVDCSTLDQSLVKSITTLGVRSLYPNIFPKDIVLPKEMRSYIYEPNSNGIVMAIAAALRRQRINSKESSHSGVSTSFDLISNDDRNYIRNFLTSPTSGDLSFSSKSAIKSFPIFKSYMDGQTSDTAYVSLERSGNWLLLEDPLDSDMPFLTSDFLVCEKRVEMNFLLSLGAKMTTRGDFVRNFVIPQISFMETDLLEKSFGNILLNLSVLCSSDPEFEIILSNTRFISCENPEGGLKAPSELYDPDVPQLRSLMGSDFFPSEFYTKSNSLMLALRALGLQSTLTWDVVLECASSIELSSSSDSQQERDIVKARGKELLKFLDMNVATFFPKLVKKEVSTATRFFRSVNKALFEDAEETKRKAEEHKQRVRKLLNLRWIPVFMEPPHPYLPWQLGCSPVASPLETSVKEKMWLVSYKKHLVDCDVHSEELKGLFGWHKPASIEDVAHQLKMFSHTFDKLNQHSEEIEKTNQSLENDGSENKNMKKEGTEDKNAKFNSICQVFSSEVPRIYQILNGVTSDFDIVQVKNILHESSWLWMGDGFVPSDHVAYTSPINAAPYLYTVPPDLACFRNLLSMFGVRHTFGSSDYCQALQRMAEECAKSETKQLPSKQIELAVSLVQTLSDDVMKLSALEIFVPSADRKIYLASEMVYDDAPWMSRDTTIKRKFIYCHQKISAAVAEKIGVKSVRSLLIQNNADLIQFGDGIVHESFGQSEALTRRLKNIIEMYPEGPQQLSELVQNADDAKASIVRFILSEKKHGEASLLGQKLGAWQGPAFLVYNDAVFSSRDFQNLSKIGQASKLEKLATTGRFGLGFNSVFHWTDVPSVVSGDHLVMFDPHAKYVPGATDTSRGIKIKFTGTSLANQFPDQMLPYCHFGNDMERRFEGTLFRFPFRNETTARESEISKNQCLEDGMISELIESFKKSIPKFLLFLRHVNRIEFYQEKSTDKVPQLLYYAEVTDRMAIKSHESVYSFTSKLFGAPSPIFSSDWNAIPKFLSGPPSQPLAKEAVYSKLSKTPENQLPKTKHLVSITFFNREELAKDKNEVKIEDGFSENMIKDEYIVCTALGGGKCREMACDPRFSDMKFLPWAGVAAHLSRNSSDAPNKEGNAFCFLPLPAETGLPVHINGYFELSANRRDIWHGEDMTGAGQVRSLWNRLLLNDVISPIYCELLLSIRDILGHRDKYYQLWPTKSRSDVWDIVKHGVYKAGQNMPLLYTPLDGGKWVSPNSSFLIDEKKGENKRLMRILLKEKINIVSIPSPIIQTLQGENWESKYINPSLVRSLLKLDGEHPCLQREDDALFLLRYCIEDIIEIKIYDDLIGLPLLPLCNGNLAKILEPNEDKSQKLFVATQLEKNILSNASNYIVNVWTDEEQVNLLLTNPAFQNVTNLKPLLIEDFVSLLGYSYPPEWLEQVEVPWNPCDKSSSFSPESKEWLSSLWDYIASLSEAHMDAFHSTWQILPVLVGQEVRSLLQLSDKLSVINPIDPRTFIEYLDEEVMSVIHCIGIKTLDVALFKEKYRNAILRKLNDYLQPPTVHGVITALINSLPLNPDDNMVKKHLSLRFRHLSDSGKDCLLSFLTDPRNVDKGKSFDSTQIQVLRGMPVFQLYNEGNSIYGDLMGDKYLPPSCADPALLDCKFIKATSRRDVDLLEKIGIETMSPSLYYENHVCPKLVVDGLLTDCHNLALEQLLGDIPRLDKESNESGWILRLSEQMIIPNRSGNLLRAKDLYDPNESNLEEILDDSMLPAEEICGGLLLNSLRLLGLQSKLNSDGVIECARSIEHTVNNSLMKESIEESQLELIRKRAMALLRFLDDDETIGSLLAEIEEGENDGLLQINDGSISNNLSFSKPKFENNFLLHLNTIGWLPVETRTLHELSANQSPPRKHAQSAITGFSSPQDSRPKCDEWLCSSSMDILPYALRSKKLEECFKWDCPPNLVSVCHQVLALAESSHIRVNTLAKVMPTCYEAINTLLQSASDKNKDEVLKLIAKEPWIWVGDGFVPSNRVAFDAPEHASPYLFQVPKDMAEFKELLNFFGVKKSFAPNDFVRILSSLATDAGERQCSEKQLDLAIFIARYLGRLSIEELKELGEETIYLPSRDGRMFIAKEMTYDDAPWLSAIISNKGRTRHIFVNESISNDTAAKLGTKSLRDVLSAHKNGMVKIPCPKKESLEQLFSESRIEGLEQSQVILDLLEIAEINMAKQVSIMIDYRLHESISVLHPCLANLQGPSVVICFHDIVLEIDQIIKLTSPSKYYMAATSGENGSGGQGFPRMGRGLCGAFSFTDCLQVLTGSSLLFFDPTGEYFVDGSLKHSMSSNDEVEDSKDDENHDNSSSETKLHLKPSARNYCISSSFCAQFPDQFKPFYSLPFGVEESIINSSHDDSSAFFRGTILRLPLRTQNDNNMSSLCQITFEQDKMHKLAKDLEARLPSSFLFTYHLQSINVDEWKQSSGSFSPILRSRVSSSPLSRRNHIEKNSKNEKWIKESNGRLKNMFKSSWVPEKSTHTLEISHRHNNDSEDMIDTFIINSILAPPRLRELANTAVIRQLKLTPIVSIAAHVCRRLAGTHSDSRDYSIPTGTVFIGLDTGINTGLPFILNAPLFLNEWTRDILFEPDDDAGLKKHFRDLRYVTIKDKSGQLEKRSIALSVWNRQALTSTMKELIPLTLRGIRDPVQFNYYRNSRQLYRFWPYYSRIQKPFQTLMTDDIYHSLTTDESDLFLTEKDGFKTVDGGLFVSPEYPLNSTTASFFLKQTSLFTVPKLVIDDLIRVGVTIRQLTPSVARCMLKKDKVKQYLSTRPRIALDMLEYCLADLKSNTSFSVEQKLSICQNELKGLCLVPLSDGTVGTFGRQMILASPEQQSLLPNLKSKFISQHVYQKLSHFFEDSNILSACGITKFNAKTLAHHIPSVLPSSWEGKDFVIWPYDNSFQASDNLLCDGIPNPIWIYRFWKEVSLFDHDSLQMFRLWPLIPTTSGELGSCANARNILCFCINTSNSDLREKLIREDSSIRSSIDSALKDELVLKAAENRALSTSFNTIIMNDESFWKMGEESDTIKSDVETNQTQSQSQTNTRPVDGQVNGAEMDNAIQEAPIDSADDALSSNSQHVTQQSSVYDPNNATLLALHNILVKIRCPLLDTSFFSTDDIPKILPPDRLDVSRRILNTLNQCNNYWSSYGSSGELRLRWSHIETMEFDIFLQTICEHDGSRISLMPSDLEALKRLPIFETFAGNRVSLSDGNNNFTIDESVDLTRLDDYLPMSLKEKFLLEKAKFCSLYQDLNVERLNDGRILTKFVLPAFHSMPLRQKEAVNKFILEKWNTLKDSNEFIDVLKVTPFVKRSNVLGGEICFVNANEVYDPRNEFLHGIFDSHCSYFPAEEFRDHKWLDILSIIGLKNKVDKDTFLECAKEVESGNDSKKAMLLFEYYAEHFADFYNNGEDFLRSLREIRCVPASFNDGPIEMFRFSEIAVHKDRNLVFRVLPVVPGEYSPPQVLFSSLGIVSPPSIGNVLKQIRELTENKVEMDHWTYKHDSIEVVFGCIFSFLQDNFAKLSPLVQSGLKERAIVPVGTTLVKANRLFFRLPKDLSPFFFEVPRAFGAYDNLLRSLGVRDSPKPGDYAHSLSELHDEIAGGRLNANELKSVIEVITLIASGEGYEDGSSFLNIYAPASSGRLLRVDSMFINDCEWLVQSGKIDKKCLHLAHPKLSFDICGKLGIESLSQNIEEIQETDYIPIAVKHTNSDLSRIECNLQSDIFAEIVRTLNPKTSPLKLSVIKTVKIAEVEEIRTKYMLKIKREQCLVDITNYSQREKSYFFLQGETLFLAKLPVGVTPELAVASSLCDFLHLERKFVAGLSAVLSSDPDVVPVIKEAMGLFENNSDGERWRGEPGKTLCKTDIELSEIKPLKIYNKGEIVAVKDDSSNLIYGTITGCSESSRGSSVSRLRVFIGNGKEVNVLSSEVRSFRGGSTDTQSNNVEYQRFGSNIDIIMDRGILQRMEKATTKTEDFESCLFDDDIKESKNENNIAPVEKNEILHAVEDLLLSANLSLGDDTKAILTSNLTLKGEIEQKNAFIESLLRNGRETSEHLSKSIDSFLCPITRETMIDPVMCCDGHTYERKAIEQWLRSSSRSPKTNQPLSSRNLIPNHAMRNSIEAMRENIFTVKKFTEMYK